MALPGLATALGTITAGAPQALGASGDQKGTSSSAIANGTILITSGDAASQEVADSISRDTEAANGGALTQEFDEARRAEIQEGFAVTKELIAQTSIFFANRAKKQEVLEKRSKSEVVTDEDGNPIYQYTDVDGQTISVIDPDAIPEGVEAVLTPLSDAQRQALEDQADELDKNFGAGSPARIIATAINGAAGGNAAGGLGDLVRASAANVLQSLATTRAKHIADSIKGSDANSETVRAALQGLVGCAGSAAGGGDCGSAAAGAAASVVLANLLFEKERPVDKDGDGVIDGRDLAKQQAITNIVSTLVGAIASQAGLDASSAITAAQIEIENNGICDSSKIDCQTTVAEILSRNGKTLSELEIEEPERFKYYIDKFGSKERAEAFLSGRNELAVLADRLVNGQLSQEEQNAYIALLKSTGGDLYTAQNIAGLRKYYDENPLHLLELGLASPHVQDFANILTRLEVYKDFVDGATDGVVDDVAAAYENTKEVLRDPVQAYEKLKEVVVYIVNNPDEVVEALVEGGEQYVKEVRDASILLEAAIIADEPKLQEQAAETLGRLVGTPLVEGLLTAGAGAFAIKIGGKILTKVNKAIGGENKVPENNGSSNPDTNGNGDTSNAANDALDGDEDVKQLPSPEATAAGRRNSPGVASHDGSLPTIRDGDDWIRGSEGNAARVPSQIAEKLAGKEFRSFDHFREEFWKAVADDPVLRSQFTPQNRQLMRDGFAPFSASNQQVGGRVKFELDHNQPIVDGGNVYDLNNIIIRTPLNHVRGK